MNRWNFPSNGDGQIKGIADAGIENFNGTEISSLAREICQNSLDAAIDENNPNVIVEFYRYRISENQIPGRQEYCTILQGCKAFWDQSKSEKAKKFLINAYDYIKKRQSYVLRISDYNTKGLADPYGKVDPYGISIDGWNSLVKIDGGANKAGDKAGAFGIGKSAPFCNSHYRLVFYRTLNKDGERAAQGISRLLSYPKEEGNSGEIMTNGIGYFGNSDGNMPVEKISELDELNKRDNVGTDVFIYGFNGPAADWEEKIITAILDSFLVSIFKGNLSIKVQNVDINADSLGRLVERYSSSIKNTYFNYQVLTRKEVYEYSMDFHGMGTIDLKILISSTEKLDKKILIVRKAGMKLFRLGKLSKLVSFSGILELHGKKLNEYFREMETVAHDDWIPNRHSNPKEAKRYYEEIKEWIRNIIAELGEFSSNDEMDIEGLGGVLQKEQDCSGKENTGIKRENLNDHLGQIKVIMRPNNISSKGYFHGKGKESSKKVEKVDGILAEKGNDAIRVLKGNRQRKKYDKHKGYPDLSGNDIVVRNKQESETSCPLNNVRIIKQGNGRYVLGFEIPRSAMRGKIELVAVGENGKSNKMKVSNATLISGCSEVHISEDSIAFSGIEANKMVRINIMLADTHDYAMEVNVYEYY